jgi:hypothetical protein
MRHAGIKLQIFIFIKRSFRRNNVKTRQWLGEVARIGRGDAMGGGGMRWDGRGLYGMNGEGVRK